MRKSLIPVFALALIVAVSQFCSKGGGGGGGGGCTETAIAASTTPALNTVDPPAPGPDFPLAVNITAGLPTAGVTIVVKAAPESPAGAAAFYTETRNSTTTSNSFTITGTPAATSCIVTVTITSKSCNTNTFSGTYRYSRK